MNFLELGVVALAAQLLACTSNARVAPSPSVELNDASAVGSPGDGGIDCDDLVITEWGKVVRACVHEAPIGAVADEEPGGHVVVHMGDAIIASYDQCPCGGNQTVLVIPAGSQPESYLPTGLYIEAATYDQTCQLDADCAAVYEGWRCGAECGCDNAAINKRDQVLYRFDQKKGCLPESAFFVADCHCPSYGNPVCRQNRCVLSHDNGAVGQKETPGLTIDGGPPAPAIDGQIPSGHDGGDAVDAATHG